MPDQPKRSDAQALRWMKLQTLLLAAILVVVLVCAVLIGTSLNRVDHSIDLVERICDRACWIEKGVQKMVGPTDTVCEAYRNYNIGG